MAISNTIITVAIVLGLVILLGLGIMFFYIRAKSKKKFSFLLYNAKGDRINTVYGQLKTDPQNKSKRLFYFADSNNFLEIRPPTVLFDNKPFREIIFNDLGEISYLENTKINVDKFRELSVKPEEKALSFARFKENNARYENPLDRAQIGLLIGGFILVLLIGIGVIYSTITYSNVVKDHIKIAQSNSENAKIMKETTNTMGELVERIAQITASLTNNAGIVRQIT